MQLAMQIKNAFFNKPKSENGKTQSNNSNIKLKDNNNSNNIN